MVKRRDFLMNTGGTAAGLGAFAAAGSAQSAGPQEASTSGDRPIGDVLNPAYIDTRLDCRSISFENPTGARGEGGKTARGRKGHPFHVFKPGEKVALADLAGPGTLRHIWMTVGTWRPEVMRALRFEVFYDGLSEPSVSVPLLDFFGLPHGRLAEYYSAMTSVHEGRGLNSYMAMPFAHSARVEFTNESARHVTLYYQIDYTLEPALPGNPSYLHAAFRRENPTIPGRDFVIFEGLKGPGRFLGCSVGIRTLEQGRWYGEGEVKIYRDGDTGLPTYCGTGLEDYAGSAYGLGRHSGAYSGMPINIPTPPPDADPSSGETTEFMSFYRWHLPDPIMFSEDLRVTIQQIGSALFLKGQETAYAALKSSHADAGHGWLTDLGPAVLGFGLYERSDDYCATGFVYCRQPQAVTRYRTELATGDIALLPVEAKDKAFRFVDVQDPFNMQLMKYWGE
jgi:hypothetical protein